MAAPAGTDLFCSDLFQLLGADDVAVEAGFLGALAVGDAHQGAVVDHGHLELGAVLGVDLVLVNFGEK